MITKKITIVNKSNLKEPYEFIVQANKNLGIINITPRIGEVLTDFQGRQINDKYVMEHLKNVLYYELNND